MPTNEERREVAEQIRKIIEGRYSFTALNVADAIGVEEVIFDDRYAFDEACWLRLTDLIEPEPERICQAIPMPMTSHQFRDWKCSLCGQNLDAAFNYCPNCGEKVFKNAN